MKRTLLATTALCMGAGTAMAMDQGMSDGMGTGMAQNQTIVMGDPKGSGKIVIKGAAEMGVAGDKDGSARFHTDIGLEFAMSGHTDGGVEFGTTVELADGDDGDRDEHGGIAVHLKGPFGALTLGDTDGALDWALRETDDGLAGSIGDEHRSPGRMDNAGLDRTHDGQILRYDYSFSGFGFAGSMELDDEIDGEGGHGEAIVGIGGKYSMDVGGNTVGAGVGYQMGRKAVGTDRDSDPDTVDADDRTVIGASADVKTTYGITLIGNYVREHHEDSVDAENHEMTVHFAGLGIGYVAGPVSLGVNMGTKETDRMGEMDDEDTTGIGLAVNYDLGGGASVKFGASTSETDLPEMEGKDSRDTDTNRWSLGVAFSF